MIVKKTMRVKEFIDSHSECDEELLEKIYKQLEKENLRLFTSRSPLYECGNGRIYGGGDCLTSLSHRKGYGFTFIRVEDRGYWRCGIISDEAKKKEKIAFIDGDFEEVCEELKKWI